MLELLANNHDVWIRMVISFGCNKDTAEDIVQSFYLRMHKYVKDESRIMYNDEEVNRFFVYVTLKNMYKTYIVSESRYQFFETWEEEYAEWDDETVYDENTAFGRLITKIQAEMNTWHRYDKLLSEKYLKSDYSLREIAKGTGISLTSIFNSMKHNKRILRDKFKEDWEDFKNGDYNLI